MKITIYELLGMIKDNNTPKKILYKEQIYEYTRIGYYDSDNGETLFDTYYIDEILNDEVTILETTITYKKDEQNDKIEYLDDFYKNDRFGYSIDLEKVRDKINEIIDHLNNKQ